MGPASCQTALPRCIQTSRLASLARRISIISVRARPEAESRTRLPPVGVEPTRGCPHPAKGGTCPPANAYAGGGDRTLMPYGHTILSRARLPIPPLRRRHRRAGLLIPPRRRAGIGYSARWLLLNPFICGFIPSLWGRGGPV